MLAQSTTAFAGISYQGGGAWGSSNITYRIYTTGVYATAASAAMTNWSGYESDPYGTSQMCTTTACWDPLPWDTLYTYGEALGNVTRISGWELNNKQYVFAHEIGHTLSLGHADQPGDLMYGSCCTTYDDYHVYRTTWTEISAINARY